MTSRLRPCAGCGRHVRVSDSSCPFCGNAISADGIRGEGGAVIDAARPLSRAAVLFFSATALAGCVGGPGDTSSSSSGASSTSSSSGGSSGTSGTSNGDPGPAPAYGPAPVPITDSGPNPAPAYGPAPIQDAGIVPMYGPAPVDGG